MTAVIPRRLQNAILESWYLQRTLRPIQMLSKANIRWTIPLVRYDVHLMHWSREHVLQSLFEFVLSAHWICEYVHLKTHRWPYYHTFQYKCMESYFTYQLQFHVSTYPNPEKSQSLEKLSAFHTTIRPASSLLANMYGCSKFIRADNSAYYVPQLYCIQANKPVLGVLWVADANWSCGRCFHKIHGCRLQQILLMSKIWICVSADQHRKTFWLCPAHE